MKICTCLVSTALLANLVFANSDKQIIKGKDSFQFHYQFTVPTLTEPTGIWFPLAQSSDFQQVTQSKIDSPRELQTLEDPRYGNQVLYGTFTAEDSGKMVKVHYKVNRKEKPPYADPNIDRSKYLQADRLVPLTGNFRAIAETAIIGKRTEVERARALYDHVLQEMRYSKAQPGYGRGDAQHACDAKFGNCTDFHAYFIALARTVDIPARFTIGATIPADRDSGKVGGYHCWAEFFADGKWWPVDISEAEKHPELTEYYFGAHPANRFAFTQGRDLALHPGPAGGPINFLAYPFIEVDGKPINAVIDFQFERNVRD